MTAMSIWTEYDTNTIDYPGLHVARETRVYGGGRMDVQAEALTWPHREHLVEHMSRLGLVFLTRSDVDPAVIVGCWV